MMKNKLNAYCCFFLLVTFWSYSFPYEYVKFTEDGSAPVCSDSTLGSTSDISQKSKWATKS